MLFGYPISATKENWLHDCLYEILDLIHDSIQTATTLPEWPEIIPMLYRKKLERRTGLRDRLNIYQITLEKLTTTEQRRIIKALYEQNQIADLLSCQLNCDVINDLPRSIQKPVTNLFAFAFDLLTDFGIRDHQYTKIYEAMQHRICPFCGCENFDSPKRNNNEGRREALDHYLAKSLYPFAAANLRNLAPIGNKCNFYKLDQNLLRRDDGTSRRSFDPYNCIGIKLSLNNSQPFAGTITAIGQLPRWQIDFSPNNQEVITWDEVFHIRERYEKNVLDAEFNSWLRHFNSWCESTKIVLSSNHELVDALHRYANLYATMGMDERAFLKASVFQMLHIHCQNGDQRLISFLMSLRNPETTP